MLRRDEAALSERSPAIPRAVEGASRLSSSLAWRHHAEMPRQINGGRVLPRSVRCEVRASELWMRGRHTVGCRVPNANAPRTNPMPSPGGWRQPDVCRLTRALSTANHALGDCQSTRTRKSCPRQTGTRSPVEIRPTHWICGVVRQIWDRGMIWVTPLACRLPAPGATPDRQTNHNSSADPPRSWAGRHPWHRPTGTPLIGRVGLIIKPLFRLSALANC